MMKMWQYAQIQRRTLSFILSRWNSSHPELSTRVRFIDCNASHFRIYERKVYHFFSSAVRPGSVANHRSQFDTDSRLRWRRRCGPWSRRDLNVQFLSRANDTLALGAMCVRRFKFDKEAMQKTKLMVSNLKSTGQSKFALEEKDEVCVAQDCMCLLGVRLE